MTDTTHLIIGHENLSDNAYFIKRIKDNYYIHFGGDFDKDNVVYFFNEEKIGACAWTKEKGELFIKTSNLQGVKLIQCKQDI